MKYVGMPAGMWLLFKRLFKHNLSSVLGFEKEKTARIGKAAKNRYKKNIASLPEFEKGDRFKMNIVNCAMLSSFYLNMKKKPTVEQMTRYYCESMMTGAMKLFCRRSGKRSFTKKHRRDEKYRPFQSGGQEQILLEYGLLSLPGRLGLRGEV